MPAIKLPCRGNESIKYDYNIITGSPSIDFS